MTNLEREADLSVPELLELTKMRAAALLFVAARDDIMVAAVLTVSFNEGVVESVGRLAAKNAK